MYHQLWWHLEGSGKDQDRRNRYCSASKQSLFSSMMPTKKWLSPTNELSFLINRVLLTQTLEVSTLAMDGLTMVSSFLTWLLRKFRRTDERPMVKNLIRHSPKLYWGMRRSPASTRKRGREALWMHTIISEEMHSYHTVWGQWKQERNNCVSSLSKM